MRNLFWICAALIVISSIASANLWHELREERLLEIALQAQQRATPAQVRKIMPSLARAEQPSQVAAPVPPPAAPTAQAAPVIEAQTLLRNAADRQRELWKDPAYRKARLAQMRTSVRKNNPGLAEELELSEAEANRLFDLLTEHEMNLASESSLLITGPGDVASIQDRMRKQQEMSRQGNDAIAALLSPAKYTQWQQYEQNAPARSRALSMNNMLAQAGQPLNGTQLKSLMAALVPEIRRQQEPVVAQEMFSKRQEESNQRLLAAAAPFMSAQQLSIVRAAFEQQGALSRAYARARERATAAQPLQ